GGIMAAGNKFNDRHAGRLVKKIQLPSRILYNDATDKHFMSRHILQRDSQSDSWKPLIFRIVGMVCFFIAAVFGSAARGGDNWPEFRGPSGYGRADAVGLPIRWSETENIKWKVPIHDKGWSSPVIWG